MNIINFCEEYEMLIDHYVNKCSTPEQTAKVFMHLGSCSCCARALMEAFLLKKAMAARQITVPEELSAGIFEKIKTSREEQAGPEQILSQFMQRTAHGQVGVASIMQVTQDLISWALNTAAPALAG